MNVLNEECRVIREQIACKRRDLRKLEEEIALLEEELDKKLEVLL